MKAPVRSNCLFGAVAIKRQVGGKLEWQPGWQTAGWKSFLGNPWGHFQVRLGDAIWSYSALDKNMSVWNQLWFQGCTKRRELTSENR
jgi:hypothetical protein